LAEIRPKPQKRIGECFVCDEPADIREGKTGSALDDMPALGVCLDAIRVDPGQGRGQQAELEMVRDRIAIFAMYRRAGWSTTRFHHFTRTFDLSLYMVLVGTLKSIRWIMIDHAMY